MIDSQKSHDRLSESSNSQHIAHIAEDGRCHYLVDHLAGTSRRSSEFAAAFGCAEWGALAGIWHDLGKFSDDFQRYIKAVGGLEAHLETKPGRVNHSTAGGIRAIDNFGKLGRILAYLIAGHHAGLPDWQSDRSGKAGLAFRLQEHALLDTLLHAGIPVEILEHSLPSDRPPKGVSEISQSFWLRMLFSCLVDADFLDTEEFFEPVKFEARNGYPLLLELLPLFDQYMKQKQESAEDTYVNRIRASIFKECINKSTDNPGLFTLTVPTGGGKTLSSLAFALHHAIEHNQQRIIYVIPYTSIIEQTADQVRKIFGDVVVEHHSNFEAKDDAGENARDRLACENWDAPIIVTTSVQFFESLFAARTSRCRKLHNIANSVVILDEAQLLPPDFLAPILESLTELQKNYRVSVMLCTATQPSLAPHHTVDYNFKGLSGLVEIMSDSAGLYRDLHRTKIIQVGNLLEAVSWEEIAEYLQESETVLCIVNRRDDARLLWELMPEGTFHLSALMCGAHRSKVIDDIKQRLVDGVPTRVISTQLVEAGVDMDFPVVYRALAGLDSIAQAAGRCNREGMMQQGTVYVFTPPSSIPAGHLRQAAEIGRRLLLEDANEPLAPERFEAFFREFYWMRGDRLDKEHIIDLLKKDSELRISFREAASKFHLIDDKAQASLIVRYNNHELLALLDRGRPDRWILRKLQRSVINLPVQLHRQLLMSGAIREVHPGIFIQDHAALYHEMLGFCADKSLIYAPDELIC